MINSGKEQIVSFETLYGGQLTLSTQLIKPTLPRDTTFQIFDAVVPPNKILI